MVRKGFTLIELLIVVAVLSILAVAVLSAINPVEQLRKARDAARKSDSAELLNAYERYFTTFGCWPWERPSGVPCDTSLGMATVAPSSAVGGDLTELTAREEIKTQFVDRTSIVNNWFAVTEAATAQVSVCFVPESVSARTGGMGPIRMRDNTVGTTDCTDAYSDAELDCAVCVPQ